MPVLNQTVADKSTSFNAMPCNARINPQDTRTVVKVKWGDLDSVYVNIKQVEIPELIIWLQQKHLKIAVCVQCKRRRFSKFNISILSSGHIFRRKQNDHQTYPLELICSNPDLPNPDVNSVGLDLCIGDDSYLHHHRRYFILTLFIDQLTANTLINLEILLQIRYILHVKCFFWN